MKMTIDAMDLMASGRVTGFGLMSSDSDFTPLVTRLRQEGLPVYGFGTAKTPQAFRSACTTFIAVGALTSARETPVELAESTAEPPSPAASTEERRGGNAGVSTVRSRGD